MTTILTYAFVPAGVATVIPGDITSTVPSNIKTSMKKGFREWEKHGDFLNVEVPHSGGISPGSGINVNICVSPLSGPGGSAAMEVTYSGSGANKQDFKSLIYWDVDDVNSHTNFWRDWLAVHELGHGVAGNQAHNAGDPFAVMYPNSDYAGNGLPLPSERVPVASMYGSPVTFSNKLNQGKLLGDLWSIYRGRNNTTPDAAGLYYWMREIQLGNKALIDVAWGVSSSGTNTTFVQQQYQRILGRAADPSGLSFYVNALDTGAKNRPQMIVELATSAEAATFRKATQTSFWLT